MMISFIITLNRDRIKLETRADKHKEIERRSLRIVQVKEKSDDDDNFIKRASRFFKVLHFRKSASF